MAEPRRQYRDQTRRENGDWTKLRPHVNKQDEMERARKVLRRHGGQDGPYRIRVNDGNGFDDFGTNRDLDGTMKRLRVVSGAVNIGDLIDVDLTPHNATLLRIKPIKLNAHKDRVPAGQYNARVMAYLGALNKEFPGWTNYGICNCRYIAGTHTWSQHAYCNAVDVHFGTMSQMDEVYKYFNARRGQFAIATLLWRVPDHYDHVHADFQPQNAGTLCP